MDIHHLEQIPVDIRSQAEAYARVKLKANGLQFTDPSLAEARILHRNSYLAWEGYVVHCSREALALENELAVQQVPQPVPHLTSPENLTKIFEAIIASNKTSAAHRVARLFGPDALLASFNIDHSLVAAVAAGVEPSTEGGCWEWELSTMVQQGPEGDIANCLAQNCEDVISYFVAAVHPNDGVGFYNGSVHSGPSVYAHVRSALCQDYHFTEGGAGQA